MLSFQVRIGAAGSLTIEMAAAPDLPIMRNLATLQPPITQGVIEGDEKLLSIGWAQGWAVPMTERLIALGGNTRLQLLTFTVLSLDTTDNGWGATGTLDASSDPATFQATLTGASVFGRTFAPGRYVLWNDAVAQNGLWKFEIDQITAIANPNVWTVKRTADRTPPGLAQFGSVKAAHAAVQILPLLAKQFYVLWDGTPQVFKFLWDGMIVSAVSLSTPGLTNPVIKNLFSIPPAAASLGLAT